MEWYYVILIIAAVLFVVLVVTNLCYYTGLCEDFIGSNMNDHTLMAPWQIKMEVPENRPSTERSWVSERLSTFTVNQPDYEISEHETSYPRILLHPVPRTEITRCLPKSSASYNENFPISDTIQKEDVNLYLFKSKT